MLLSREVRPESPTSGASVRLESLTYDARDPIPRSEDGRSTSCDLTIGQTRFGSQLRHAIESVAFLDEAGGAPDAALNGGDPRAEGTGELGAGARVDADHARTGRRGQMKRAGVVGDHQVRLGRQRRQLEQAVRPQRSRTGTGPRCRTS